MPTPMRVQGLPVHFGVVRVIDDIRPPGQGLSGCRREGPPPGPGQEEACDKRSPPQDVTSSWARHGGANLKQEVAPQQTARPPRDSSFEDNQPGLLALQ